MKIASYVIPPKVKICGITNGEDALCACQCGADLLGFIFYKKSPRKVSVRGARHIITQLPSLVVPVGVFVNADKTEILRVVEYCGLKAVQLHGDESPAYCREISRVVPVIKAIRVRSKEEISFLADYPQKSIFLLDTYDEKQWGGTGRTGDWDIAREVKKKYPYSILSGGLTPANICQAIRNLHPYAVDVCSGVERSAGRKDVKALELFIHRAKTVRVLC